MAPRWCYLGLVGRVAPITFAGRLALAVLATALSACNDLRDFRGPWQGPRVGDAAALKVGVAEGARATLDIGLIDVHGLAGTLTVDGLVTAAPLEPVAGAQADVLAGMSFNGSPLRVYLGFVPVDDGAGEAIAVVSLYDDDRVEVRLLRGGTAKIYAIFALER
jgi:hypothetical protein